MATKISAHFPINLNLRIGAKQCHLRKTGFTRLLAPTIPNKLESPFLDFNTIFDKLKSQCNVVTTTTAEFIKYRPIAPNTS
jgi:hypothetical protein